MVDTPAPDRPYANVLSAIRQYLVPDESSARVRRVRKSASGGFDLHGFRDHIKFQEDHRIGLGQQNTRIRFIFMISRIKSSFKRTTRSV